MSVSSYLAGLLILGAPATVVGTALLFAPPRKGRPASRLTAWAASLALAVCGLVVLRAVGADPTVSGAAMATVLVASAAWLPATRTWNARGHAVWVAATLTTTAYLAFMLLWTARSADSGVTVVGGALLWFLELVALVLGTGYLWEVVDVMSHRRWDRRSLVGADSPSPQPFVSLHVPAHNEPPEMVIATLESLLELDYPAYEIVMIDDNTDDESLWRPVEVFCRFHGIKFHHLEDWPGYKSGALNFALTVVDPRTEVVGVVDADYIVDADWLSRCAPLFGDEKVAFVQTPQNYREWRQSRYYRRLFYSYEYFFVVSQTVRNERDGAIFGGTMGLVRHSALTGVGGWDEWCITEDAELSLRLLKAGWSGRHVEKSYGHGVMPLTFEALKRQRFRWCFGGVQILRAHWRSLMPWDRAPDNGLSQRQRAMYLLGGLAWFGDLLALAFALLLALGAIAAAFGADVALRRLTGVLLILPPLGIALGVLRTVGALRRRTDASWRDAAGAFGIWLALGWTVALACWRGITQRDGVFLRTPKTRGDASLRDAVTANRTETAAGVVLAVLAGAVLAQASLALAAPMAVLLAWHATALLLAPANSVAAMRAELSDDMRRMRRNEWIKERGRRVRPVPIFATAGAGSLAVAVTALVLGGGVATNTGSPADIVGEARIPIDAPGQDPVTGGVPSTDNTPSPSRGASADPTSSGGASSPPGTAGADGIAGNADDTTGVAPSAPASSAGPQSSPTVGGVATAGPGTTATPGSTTAASARPTAAPSAAPTSQPTGQPTRQPTRQPTAAPSTGPPTARPTPSRTPR